jgi:hypothetical protein
MMQDEEYTLKLEKIRNRHATIQWVTGCLSVVTIICSLIWAICIFNLENVKHPIDIQNSYERNTNIKGD